MAVLAVLGHRRRADEPAGRDRQRADHCCHPCDLRARGVAGAGGGDNRTRCACDNSRAHALTSQDVSRPAGDPMRRDPMDRDPMDRDPMDREPMDKVRADFDVPDDQGVRQVAGSVLGEKVLRKEDPKFLTTGGVYVEDFTDPRLDGAVHVVFARSPVAHGTINSIDTSAAEGMPGVLAVHTAASLALEPQPSAFNPHVARTLLASDKVRWVGEPIAAIIARSSCRTYACTSSGRASSRRLTIG